MEKDDLIAIIDKEFKPLGFKRKGNYWHLKGQEVNKVIQLQRSSFSKLYYINYGFNLVKLNYDAVPIHIYLRLGSSDNVENQLIGNLLDFENDIESGTRKAKLTEVVKNNLKEKLNKINSEDDVRREIEINPNIRYVLPLKVKEHLKVD